MPFPFYEIADQLLTTSHTCHEGCKDDAMQDKLGHRLPIAGVDLSGGESLDRLVAHNWQTTKTFMNVHPGPWQWQEVFHLAAR